MFILLSFLLFFGTQSKIPFPKEVNYAILYKYNQQEEFKSRPDDFIYSESRGYAKSKDVTGDTLNQNQIKQIEKIFQFGTHGLLNGLSSCFIPRHGVVYYNDKNTEIFSISICFECDRITFWHKSYGEIKLKEKLNLKKAENLMRELKKIIIN